MLAYPAIAREIAADPGDRRENAARGETTRTVAGSTMLNVNPLLANDYFLISVTIALSVDIISPSITGLCCILVFLFLTQ